jgi:exonuclease III
MLTILTYNISKSPEIFEALVSYVRSKNNRIVAIQEGLVAERQRVMSDVQIIPSQVEHSGLYFLVSSNLKISSINSSFHKRILAISLATQNDDLWIINIHAHSKSGLEDRAVKVSSLFSMVRSTFYSNRKRIVCGDFNCNPFEIFVSSPDALFARRDISDLEKNEMAMYNPSWRFLKERNHPKGTFHFDNLSSVICWEQLDQIILSKPLVSSLKTLVIPKRIGKIDTVASIKSTEGKGKGHLPLICTIGNPGEP